MPRANVAQDQSPAKRMHISTREVRETKGPLSRFRATFEPGAGLAGRPEPPWPRGGRLPPARTRRAAMPCRRAGAVGESGRHAVAGRKNRGRSPTVPPAEWSTVTCVADFSLVVFRICQQPYTLYHLLVF